jgi:hypothetical protein
MRLPVFLLIEQLRHTRGLLPNLLYRLFVLRAKYTETGISKQKDLEILILLQQVRILQRKTKTPP